MSLFTAVATSKLAASAVAALGLLTVGGVGTAAYTGSLPTQAQDVAHQIIGAPAAQVENVKTTATDAAATAQQKVAGKADAVKAAAQKALTAAQDKAAAVDGKAAGVVDQATAAAQKAVSGLSSLQLLDLCKADAASTIDASSAGFKSLSVAAGGAGNVGTFCADLAGQQVSVQGSADGGTSVNVTVPSAPKLPALPAKPALPSVPGVSVPQLPGLGG
ncbi:MULTISPECIES: hypothetical protein [Arthrobacter]|uniref:Protein tyrosine phosphatase n=2 Tax=Arthrobacter TaxID=1663 RepID=A0ABU9KIV0_9MICC|nr:hypothetical protein [Arthrobacter sp. YJM1]MDP5226937.1 hypothetical protein [Arthrobacter sp. YJM1]